MVLDYPVEILSQKMEKIGKEILIFNYLINDEILEVPLEKTEIKEQVNYVHRLLGGKVVYKDPSHLVNKILKVYGGPVSDLDLVHFEVLISQTLRDKPQTILPARLGKKWDPIMMNINPENNFKYFSYLFLQKCREKLIIRLLVARNRITNRGSINTMLYAIR